MLLSQWLWEAYTLHSSSCFKHILIRLYNNYTRWRGTERSRGRQHISDISSHKTCKCQMFTLGRAICSPCPESRLIYTLIYSAACISLITHGDIISGVNVSVVFFQFCKLTPAISQASSPWILGFYQQDFCRNHPS